MVKSSLDIRIEAADTRQFPAHHTYYGQHMNIDPFIAIFVEFPLFSILEGGFVQEIQFECESGLLTADE